MAGIIPLMMSERYSEFKEHFYLNKKKEFDEIVTKRSYYLIRQLPVDIATRTLGPRIAEVLSRQGRDGLWQRSTKITFDVLMGLRYVGVLDELIKNDRIKDACGTIESRSEMGSSAHPLANL